MPEYFTDTSKVTVRKRTQMDKHSSSILDPSTSLYLLLTDRRAEKEDKAVCSLLFNRPTLVSPENSVHGLFC